MRQQTECGQEAPRPRGTDKEQEAGGWGSGCGEVATRQTQVMGGAAVSLARPWERWSPGPCVCRRRGRPHPPPPRYVYTYGDIYNRGMYTCTETATNHTWLHYTKTLRCREPLPGSLGRWCWRREDGEVEAQPVPPRRKKTRGLWLCLCLSPGPRLLSRPQPASAPRPHRRRSNRKARPVQASRSPGWVPAPPPWSRQGL